MFPKLNPKMMEKAMKQLGMKQESIPAEKVIIRSADTEYVITNPDVQKLTMQGQESFQVSGNVEQKKRIPIDDVVLVMEKAQVDRSTAVRALEVHQGDIAQAILSCK